LSESLAVKLPRNVRPTAYELTLTPDLSEFTFDGEVDITIDVLSPTRSITLNAIELVVADARLTRTESGALNGTVTYEPANETATITFPVEIAPGPATLSLEFTGTLNDRLRGFYRSRYTGADGSELYLASTQFEPTDARRALPCWDEPSLKATFTVTLVVPDGLAAISNMPEETVERGDGMRTVRFATTPPMSTYLLAFAVGDMKSIEERSESGTLMRVWATSGNEERGRYALDVSLRLLDWFNDYFGIPYPLPKLDHLAIPDFAAGAMENWGCITYREPTLLVDESASSASTRQLVAEIVAHEMAHMWFGDLVTMAWWNDLWLNESFASWMGDKAVDALYPDWDKWNQFLVDDTGRALRLDGLKNSHPIEQEVDDPAEIGQLFDAISYSKGASVIRMLESYIGEDNFRAGINGYLRQHGHGNATTADLWASLAKSSGKPVGKIMDSWTKQTGYPYLDVTVNRADDEARVSATQRRFTYEALLGGDGDDDTTWQVPVAVGTPDQVRVSALMTDRQAELAIPGPSNPADWVKVNPGQTGFYRVKYSGAELARLSAGTESGELPAADRLGLADDAFALCRAGMLPATEFLELARHYRGETSQAVWSSVTTSLGVIDDLLCGEQAHAAFQNYGRDLLGPIGASVGWRPVPGEGHLRSLLRANVLAALGGFKDEPTLAEASKKFGEYIEDATAVPPDLRRAVFALAAKSGNASTYDAMWDAHSRTELQEEQVRLLAGLTQFVQPDLALETLTRSFTERVRTHEAIGVIVRTAMSPAGRDIAWQFMRERWDEVHRRYGEGGFGLMYLVETTSGFTTQERLEEVEKFFSDNPTPAAERTVRQSLEKIRLNIAWLDKNRDSLAQWLVS
jgi:puromycin-sensitive aminopeptidase